MNQARRRIINLITNPKPRFFLLLVLTPAVWWFVGHLNLVVLEWSKTPIYFEVKRSSIFNEQKLAPIKEFRWKAFGGERGSLLGRFFYNKLMVFFDQLFDWTTFLAPRLYFQAGDGTQFSPPEIEPIPSLLFVFWLWGLIDIFEKRDLKSILAIFLSGLPGFALGQKTLAFLFPTLLIYLCIVNNGIGLAVRRQKNLTISLLVIYFFYSLFLFGRMIYLTP